MISEKSSAAILKATLLTLGVVFIVSWFSLSFKTGAYIPVDRPVFYTGGLFLVVAWVLSDQHVRLSWIFLITTVTMAMSLSPALTTGTFNLGYLLLPTTLTVAAFIFGVWSSLVIFIYSLIMLGITTILEVNGLTNGDFSSPGARGVIICMIWIGFGAIILTLRRHIQKQNHSLLLTQERLRFAIEALQDGFVLYDAEDRLVMCNRRHLELYPDAGGSVAQGKRYVDLLAERVRLGFYPEAKGKEESWMAERLSQRALARNSADYETRDGRWLRVTDQHTESGGTVTITTDITEQKKAQDTLQEAAKMEAVGQLTGGLAHDFNNLLAIMVGSLDDMKERMSGSDEKLMRLHDQALSAALRAAEVTRSLLAVARRQPMEVRPHDLDDVIDGALPLLRTSAGRSITVERLRGSTRLWCRLDSQGLCNAILNLAINARDAMKTTEEKRLIISSGIETLEPGNPHGLLPGQFARIDVRDTGAGMSELVRSRALEPFFTTKTRTQGTGLGLAMVYGYARQLDGTVEIVSVEGKGTTVSILLPIVALATDAG